MLIIGKAAAHVSPQYRKLHPEVAWDNFIRFRNIIAHEYGDMLLNRLWLASTVAVPELFSVLIKLLPDESEDK